jgi:hypothetical protein
MLKTVKNKVACSPFPDQSVKTSIVGDGAVKAMRIENRSSLAPLKVLYATEDGRWSQGDVVYVHAKQYTQPWAKEVLELAGVKFILVPDTFIECFVSAEVA